MLDIPEGWLNAFPADPTRKIVQDIDNFMASVEWGDDLDPLVPSSEALSRSVNRHSLQYLRIDFSYAAPVLI